MGNYGDKLTKQCIMLAVWETVMKSFKTLEQITYHSCCISTWHSLKQWFKILSGLISKSYIYSTKKLVEFKNKINQSLWNKGHISLKL